MSSRRMTFLEAKWDAVESSMASDPDVILWGTDIKTGMIGLGGPAAVRTFGQHRVMDAPVSENAMVGVAVGAAMMGLRPIVELSVANFGTLAFDQLINQAARVRFLFGGQASCPIVVHMGMNTRAAGGSHHTDRTYPMLMNVPGLKIVCPSTPRSAKGLWTAAIRDDSPVVIYERSALSSAREETPEGDFEMPIGKADVIREGTDVTLVSVFTRAESLAAARTLEAEGISVEVIDPLSLVPLDLDTILTSVAKTGRLVVADIANETNSAASHISALVSEQMFGSLKSAVQRICTPDVHIPHSRPLEQLVFPSAERIAAGLRRVVTGSAAGNPATTSRG